MGLRIVSGPTTELLSLEECRAQCNIQPYTTDSDGAGVHPDDALLMLQQGAAREHCENFLGVSLAEKTYELSFHSFPAGAILLPVGPVVSINSVTYIDVDEAEQTLDAADYVLYDEHPQAWLQPAVDTYWPTAWGVGNAVRIRYIAGSALDSDGAGLPFAVRAAILLMLGHLYAHREDSTEKELSPIPNGVEAFLRPLRVRLGAA